MLVVDQKILAEVCDHARRSYPAECCGLLTGLRMQGGCVVHRSVVAQNLAAGDQTTRYVLDSEVLLRTMRSLQSLKGTGDQIIGFYHSHPNASPVPSQHDMAEAWTGYVYLIVPVIAGVPGTPTAWSLDRRLSEFTSITISTDAHIVQPVCLAAPRQLGGRCPPCELS